MALAVEDIARSLRGSWRLMTDGAKALDDLDLSRAGFWHSFAALGLTLPAGIALLAATRTLAGLPNAEGLFSAPALALAVLAAVALVLAAVPTALVGLVPALLRTPRFTSFVIVWNWTGIVSLGVMALPAAVFAIGWSTPAIALMQGTAFAIIVLRLRYGAARAVFGDGAAAPLIVAASALTDAGVLLALGAVAAA